MTDLNARLDTIRDEIGTELGLGGYFSDPTHTTNAQTQVAGLVAALRAVLDACTLRNVIEAVIEDNTDPRGCIYNVDQFPDWIAERIIALVAAALEES